MKDLQQRLNRMDALNMKLIKGYNVEDIINDLQNETNQKINLQNELKQITKKLSQKEKTNLILLNKTQRLTATLTLQHGLNGNDEHSEELTDFDHVEEINE